VAGAADYSVYRSAVSGSGYSLLASGIPETSYTDAASDIHLLTLAFDADSAGSTEIGIDVDALMDENAADIGDQTGYGCSVTIE